MRDSDEPTSVLAQVRSFLRSMKMVVWAFAGIRKSSASQEDVATVKPVHIVVAGLIAGLCFIATLALLVNWIVAK
ncbi:DUF2970 domain-containing protein [Rhodoferax sp.]|uniref:DUF2970 domain-containing protein n=1 Tax=Rhodoferax sp. TaxID=50421 RepID=UPI00283DC05C|nr:DUF2970 domain-containing protein [Rhodoferax sp.]MDR3371164.1 DUF2970 domain-containing protein [Rhodoferax sp.]